MTTPTNLELIKAALVDLRDTMDYVATESADDNINRWLSAVERKLAIVIDRYREDK